MSEPKNGITLPTATPAVEPVAVAAPAVEPTPEPQRPKLATAAGVAFDPRDEEVKAIAACERWINQVEAAENCRIGDWVGVPSELLERRWSFFRVGLVGNSRDEAHASEMMRRGWRRAPKGIYMHGFESDGERGIVLCCPPQVLAVERQLRMRAAATRQQILAGRLQLNAHAALKDAVGRSGDVEVNVAFGQGTGARLDAELAAVGRASSVRT